MRVDQIENAVRTWSAANGVQFSSFRLEEAGHVLKLSWPARGELSGYIDLFADPRTPSSGVVVQHGTFNTRTQEGHPSGVARWACDPSDIGDSLSELKATVDETTSSLGPQWKYTPRADIGTVKTFR